MHNLAKWLDALQKSCSNNAPKYLAANVARFLKCA